MSTYSYAKDFKSKTQAKDYAKTLRKSGRKAMVQSRSIGRKPHYFVYATKKRKT